MYFRLLLELNAVHFRGNSARYEADAFPSRADSTRSLWAFMGGRY